MWMLFSACLFWPFLLVQACGCINGCKLYFSCLCLLRFQTVVDQS